MVSGFSDDFATQVPTLGLDQTSYNTNMEHLHHEVVTKAIIKYKNIIVLIERMLSIQGAETPAIGRVKGNTAYVGLTSASKQLQNWQPHP